MKKIYLSFLFIMTLCSGALAESPSIELQFDRGPLFINSGAVGIPFGQGFWLHSTNEGYTLLIQASAEVEAYAPFLKISKIGHISFSKLNPGRGLVLKDVTFEFVEDFMVEGVELVDVESIDTQQAN